MKLFKSGDTGENVRNKSHFLTNLTLKLARES